MQNAPGIQAGLRVIASIYQAVGCRHQPPFLPGMELTNAHHSAHGKDQDRTGNPEEKLQDRALDFIVGMSQVE